jgi:CDP-diacylglycerol--serine O-phosphatidyltransferase
MTLTESTPSRPVRLGRIAAALLTLGNAACGFAAIIVMVRAEPIGASTMVTAAALIFAAWVCDMLDGRVARKFHATSPFGAALDSLCDTVSFGIAPAVMVAVAGTAPDVWPGPWFALAGAFTFLAAAVLRLARFTGKAVGAPAVPAEPGQPRKTRYFEGMPAPGAAMSIASAVLFFGNGPAVAIAAVVLAAAMVSTLPYPDVPRLYFGPRRPYWELAIPILIAVLTDVPTALLAFFAYYLLVGPLLAWRRRHRA